MAALQLTEIATCGTTIFTFDMMDRRPEAGSSQPTRWMFQMQLEILLYHNSKFGEKSTGAMYRRQALPGSVSVVSATSKKEKAVPPLTVL